MTLQLMFMAPQRKIIKFQIDGKRITYFDDNWKEGLLIMPLEDPKVKLQVKKMITSRKPTISAMGLLIADANMGKNKEQYDKCNTEEEIAEVVRKESKLKGLVEIQ